MADIYNHREVESKWQKIWDDEKAFKTSDDYTKPKYYALVEFPYPSGQGLHVGHPRPYTALDIVARKRRTRRCPGSRRSPGCTGRGRSPGPRPPGRAPPPAACPSPRRRPAHAE